MNTIQNVAAPVGRILLALMFVSAGFSKIGSYAGMQGFMESGGVPGALLPLVIALEILGGLAIILGWQTRIAAFVLAGFTLREDYDWALIGEPSRRYLWILSRTRQMDPALFDEIIGRLPALGYDPGRLLITPQPESP